MLTRDRAARAGRAAACSDAVEALDVDAVLLISRCSLGGGRARPAQGRRARSACPSLMLVWSWDNLSSKAVLHEHPDHLLVWNELQVDEAERLQGFPRERVARARGTELRRVLRRARAGRAAGPRRQDDPLPRIVEEHLARGARSGVPRVAGGRPRGARPGWSGTRRWSSDRTRAAAAGAAGGRSRPTSRSSAGRSSRPPASPERSPGVDAVVALNTSGELEAAIAGLPVVTFRAGAGAPGPGGLGPLPVPAGAERRLRDRLPRPRRARRAPRPRPPRRARPGAPTCVRRELRPPSRARTARLAGGRGQRSWSAPSGEDRRRARTEVLPPEHHLGARRAGRARPRARLRHVRAESVHQDGSPRRSGAMPRVSSAVYPAGRDDGLDGGQRLIRALRDAARYETPELRDAHANRARAYRKLQEALVARGHLAHRRAARAATSTRPTSPRSTPCSPRSTG